MKKNKEVPLPILQNTTGAYLAIGFIVAFINSIILGLSVLDGWSFVLYTSLTSLIISIALLVFIISTSHYRQCPKYQKWPAVTLVFSSFVIVGNMLMFNGAGHMANFYFSTNSTYYKIAVISAKSGIGYKRYIPSLTVVVDDSSSEKRVSKSTWARYNIGDKVTVQLKQGSLGFINVVKIQ